MVSMLTWPRLDVDGSSKLTPLEAFVTGGSSRAVAAAALCPVTVVKTRMEYSVGPQQYKVGPLGKAFENKESPIKNTSFAAQ